MDPITALGFSANVIQLVDLGARIVQEAKTYWRKGNPEEVQTLDGVRTIPLTRLDSR